MKKILKYLICLAAGITLCACSSETDEKAAVNSVVENYLTACADGDAEKAAEYISDDLQADGDLAAITSMEDMESMFDDADIPEETKESFIQSCKTLSKSIIQSWKTDSTDISGDKAEEIVTITGVNPDDLTYNLGEEIGYSASEEWLTANEEELNNIYEASGEEEAMQWMYSSLIPFLGEKMVEAVNGMDPVETSYKLTLEKSDNTWIITEIQVQTAE